MPGRDLHKSVINFRPRALHLFATNELPRFEGGMDRGVRRRLMVLTFNRTIPKGEVISDILDRIRTEEKDILLGFIVAGAVRLLNQGDYTVPPSSKVALDDWLKLDPVHEWFSECCEVDSDDNRPLRLWPLKSELYKNYKAWAEEAGYDKYKLVSPLGFKRTLETIDGVSIRASDGVRVVGAKVKPDWERRADGGYPTF
jgi:phage/plasmid-associated DNA primase